MRKARQNKKLMERDIPRVSLQEQNSATTRARNFWSEILKVMVTTFRGGGGLEVWGVPVPVGVRFSVFPLITVCGCVWGFFRVVAWFSTPQNGES